MKNIRGSNSEFLLHRSIEDLHYTSLEWLSDINFWKFELRFFHKMIERNIPKISNDRQKEQFRHLENRLVHLKGSLLEELQEDMINHEKILSDIINNKTKADDQSFRDIHKQYHEKFISFGNEIKAYKKELFDFFEQLM